MRSQNAKVMRVTAALATMGTAALNIRVMVVLQTMIMVAQDIKVMVVLAMKVMAALVTQDMAGVKIALQFVNKKQNFNFCKQTHITSKVRSWAATI